MSHLTQEQRYTIERLLVQNYSIPEIALVIEKSRTTIDREIARNSDKRNGNYRADLAQRRCKKRHSDKNKKIKFTAEVKHYVTKLLLEDFSPEQIVGFADRGGHEVVSHEAIYKFIWADKASGGTLHKHLRHQGKKYAKRGAAKGSRGIIKNRRPIEDRADIVNLKQRLGDLEIDLVIGTNCHLLTINDRATNMCKIEKVFSKEASEISATLTRTLKAWQPFLKTITSDNGKEFAYHEKIATDLDIDYYFANPYHSWERGANENMNGLIRQYFPKKMDLQPVTIEQIKDVENKLNNRPRKRFGFQTPKEVFLQKLTHEEKVAFMT